jgi:hypothetical protein
MTEIVTGTDGTGTGRGLGLWADLGSIPSLGLVHLPGTVEGMLLLQL